ncbi:hypothetical protein [Daejeonella sp. JGW-45]|uniref:hypothetical protein n=1 Tax=Daejeonella sp. JGW-45 TaxID=3034148 RepID=UPI0023ECC7C5|nr:hypothetical protein [Daejeonella sp. JGW-45]
MNQTITKACGPGIKALIVLCVSVSFCGGLVNRVSASGNTRDTIILTDSGPMLNFKQGPPIELKWDNGPVSLGMVMDMSLVRASGKTSQDLMISRIWDGLHIFQSNSFSSKDLFKPSQLVGKAGILLFQPLDWNKDGVTDLIASNRDGFLYFMPGTGVFPNTRYEESQAEVLRDPVNGLPFNVPYENPNYPEQDDLGGYIDAQYYNYTYPKVYSYPASKHRDLIIGDWGGNLWWLPDLSDGSGRPSYKGIKYRKEKSIHKAGSQYQKDLGLDYVKPAEKITDESGQPFLLGTGKAEELIFKGANTRPIVYPDESCNPGLLIIAGSSRQQFFFLKRVNSLSERKPVFRNMGEIHIAGLDKSRLNFHAILTLFENKGRNDLLLATDNYLAVIENSGWERGLPRLTFRSWMSGPDATGSFYAFNDMLTDKQGKRYIVHFAGKSWNFIPLDKTPHGIRLRYTDSLQLMDQNGVFRVEGETDPQLSPEWGYHRITRWDFDKSGRNHLIAGTDKGLFYLLKDDPATAKPGKFIYHSSGPLKDSAGNTIRIHNRAVAASLDLNEDGLEDLLVGGISYQLGIKSDPAPGGGIYYMINRGNNAEGMPVLSPPKLLELGPDFKPRINSHVSLQVVDFDNDKEKEIIIGLQSPGWNGRIYRKAKGKIALQYTGSEIMARPIKDQVLDIDGDGKYDIVRPGDETGVGYYRMLEK